MSDRDPDVHRNWLYTPGGFPRSALALRPGSVLRLEVQAFFVSEPMRTALMVEVAPVLLISTVCNRLFISS